MNTEIHITDLLPAYALGCLDPDELALVKKHLPTCPLCQTELRAYQTVADRLPLTVPLVDPPARLKQRLLNSVRAEKTAVPPAKSSWWQKLSDAGQRLFARPVWQPVALLLIVGLLISNLILWRQANRTADQLQTVTFAGTENAPGASGVLVFGRDGYSGTLIVEGMPPLNREQQYQLWLIQDGQRTDGGVFSVDPNGYSSSHVTAPQALTRYLDFGVTVEPVGGSPGPTGAKVLGTTP